MLLHLIVNAITWEYAMLELRYSKSISAVLVVLASSFASMATAADDIVFYERNNCKGDRLFSYNSFNGNEQESCKESSAKCYKHNDEARSVSIGPNVRLPLTLFISDDPYASNADDITRIDIVRKGQTMRSGIPYCISTFERNVGRGWMSMSWNNGNGLDGKVSNIKYRQFGPYGPP